MVSVRSYQLWRHTQTAALSQSHYALNSTYFPPVLWWSARKARNHNCTPVTYDPPDSTALKQPCLCDGNHNMGWRTLWLTIANKHFSSLHPQMQVKTVVWRAEATICLILFYVHTVSRFRVLLPCLAHSRTPFPTIPFPMMSPIPPITCNCLVLSHLSSNAIHLCLFVSDFK